MNFVRKRRRYFDWLSNQRRRKRKLFLGLHADFADGADLTKTILRLAQQPTKTEAYENEDYFG